MSGLSQEQRHERIGVTGFVGASEIAAVAGISQFQAPIDIWLRKLGRALDESSPQASVGLRAEKTMEQWYCEDTGTDTTAIRPSKSIRHPRFSHIGCTPDRLIYDGDTPIGAIQIKCVGARMARKWPPSEREDLIAPSDVICQVQFELEIMHELWGIERQDLVAWLGGTDFRIRTVERDPELCAMLLAAAHDFWPYVTNDEPPPVDGSESWRVYLRKLFPLKEKTTLRAPEYADHWARNWLEGKRLIRDGEQLQKEAANHLKSLIASNYGVLGDGWIATWSDGKSRRFQVKELDT